MYTNNRRCEMSHTQLRNNPTVEAESIEQFMRRVTANKEPIPTNVPPIYTPKEEGVIPDYDIRTDRFDIAYEATNKFVASERAKGAAKADTFNNTNIDNAITE